jgi:hypothetical protein
MWRRGGMVDTAALEAVERKLVGVRIPLAKSQAFPSWEGFYVLPKICLLPSNTTDANPPSLDWLR